ncbi:MAG: hypothetical protein JJT89_02300 [Nitriliruptoraceae bacterium]|nr:hypothetical protein [Nitriliruptoraceae bacterium]
MLLRRFVTSVLAAGLLAVPLSITPQLTGPAPAEASTTCTRDADAERALTRMTNGERTSRDRAALARRKALDQVARKHAHTMCSRSNLHHNPKLGQQVTNWRRVGENVGRGTSPTQIHRALMNSKGHRANILHREYREIGLGAVRDRNGRLWIVEVFRTPAR